MNQYYEIEKNGYAISTDPSKIDAVMVHNYLSEDSYWAKGITFEKVKKSIDNPMCFGLYQQDKQIGLARLITDKTTFAYLADVFILQDYRGKGLSKWLMATIHSHPELQSLRGWLLRTKDAHGLYEKFGWKSCTGEQIKRYMIWS